MFKYGVEVKRLQHKTHKKVTKWSIKLLDLESELGFTEILKTIGGDSFDYLKLLFQLYKINDKVFPLPNVIIVENKLTENLEDVLNLHSDMYPSGRGNKIDEIYFYLDIPVNDSIRILIHNEMVENDIFPSTLVNEIINAKYNLPFGFNLTNFLDLKVDNSINSQYDNLAFGNGNMYNPFSLPLDIFDTGLQQQPNQVFPGTKPQMTATKMYDTMKSISEKQDYELLKLILKILGKDLTLSLKNS